MKDFEEEPGPEGQEPMKQDEPLPVDLSRYQDVFYYFAGLVFVTFGFFKVFTASSLYPYGKLLDWGILGTMGAGCFYVFCGLGILVVRPGFAWMMGTLFLILFLELSQIGNF